VAEHLDHLQSLGVNVLYLTPFFPSRSNHRYDASSFRPGGPGARRRRGAGQAGAGRARSWHEGPRRLHHQPHGRAHEWFRKAQADPECEERGFYFWEDGGYASWLGVKSLPKLNYDSRVLRQRVFEDAGGVVRRWISGRTGWTAGGSTSPT